MMAYAELEKLRADAATTVNDHRAAAKNRYDARHSKPTTYSLGDLVLVENKPYSVAKRQISSGRYPSCTMEAKALQVGVFI
uniref:Uncharacterized protein n=1 Tax=Drosophila pseudoobscura pseudoobscura TaxID=46245 RepID=A0A0R3P1A8_DROPS